MSGALLAALNSNGDKTPAAVDWANISGAHGSDQSNANQTITGITRQIYLLLTANSTANSPTISYVKNGGAKVAICTANSPDPTLGIQFGPFSNTDTVHFVASAAGAYNSAQTIQNASMGNATLDTFSITLS